MTLITERAAPPNRMGRHDGACELHLTEAAVMCAMAMWLLERGAEHVRLHPDGMQLKSFDMAGWLVAQGFIPAAVQPPRSVAFERAGAAVVVKAQSGQGDIVARVGNELIEIEAKGGCINTRHPGQLSRLRKGLHEAVGQLMSSPRDEVRLIAAVPEHHETRKLADRLARRCALVGVDIALVDATGKVSVVGETA